MRAGKLLDPLDYQSADAMPPPDAPAASGKLVDNEALFADWPEWDWTSPANAPLVEATPEPPPAPTLERDSRHLEELDKAKERDAQSRLFRALEQAALTGVAALGQTKPLEALTEPTNEAAAMTAADMRKAATAQQQAQRMRELEYLEAGKSQDRAIAKSKAEADRVLGLEKLGLAELARRETLGAKIAELEVRKKQLESASMDRQLDRESRERMAAEALALREELARLAGERAQKRDETRAQEKADKEAKGRPLPATTIERLSQLPVASNLVDEIVATFNRLKMGTFSGRMNEIATDVFGLRGTRAAEYGAAALRGMQAAGKILEGGKLAAGDELKYIRLLPRPGDSAAVVAQKSEGLKDFLRELQLKEATALREAHMEVPDSFFPPPRMPRTAGTSYSAAPAPTVAPKLPTAAKPAQAPAAPAPKSTSQDEADLRTFESALAANPNDPRAPKIKAAIQKLKARLGKAP